MRSSLVACAALLAMLVLAPTAGAAVKASAALQRSGDAFVLQVRVTSTKAFTASTRPRSVKVGSLSLKRSTSTRKAVTFKSKSIPAAEATRLNGSNARIRVTSRSGTKTLRSKVAGAPPEAPTGTAPTGTAPTAPGTPPPSQPDATRDDAAGQAAMAGDLLLEWYSFGSSGRTAEYRRLWFLSDGSFRINIIDWNDVSGESCTNSVTGTWAFKEGYTHPAGGGLVLVKVGLTTAQGAEDLVLTFANAEPNNVYVGVQNPVKYERNPQIRAC